MPVSSAVSLRERKKAQTRHRIQQEALRLFLAKGYDATSVDEISAAAGVSHMTFFRNFPVKEDVVMTDEYDPLLVDAIGARPAQEPPLLKLRRAVAEAFGRVYPGAREEILVRTRLILTTPALRTRLWEQQNATERLIVDALAKQSAIGGREESALALRVVAAAALATVSTALSAWVESDGTVDLPGLVEQAFALLCREAGVGDG